jgi:hypothetical protein
MVPDIDYTGLPLVAVISTLLFFAVIDTAVAYGVALMNGNFNAAYALDFLRTHILKVGAPIALLAIVGHGVPQAQIPPIPFAALAATGGLAIYALTTIASIRDSFEDKAVSPTATSAIAPVVEPPANLAKPQ